VKQLKEGLVVPLPQTPGMNQPVAEGAARVSCMGWEVWFIRDESSAIISVVS